MNAEILAIGTELLMGQTVNSNAAYISKGLAGLGISVYYHTVVGDNPQRLKACLETSLGRSDVIVITGGLGPTQDDLTRETVADVLGVKLVVHEEIREAIECFFKKRYGKMPENNIKQACVPEGGIIIPNENGTAPGCILEKEGKVIIMLPGPPLEMVPMFDGMVTDFLKSKSEAAIRSVFLKVFGIGESALEKKLEDLISNQTDPTIATYVDEGEVSVRITSRAGSAKEADERIRVMEETIRGRLGNAVFSSDGRKMEQVVVDMLKEKGLRLSIAESCTGGRILDRITNVPGASEVLDRGVVAYSNKSKEEILGVKRETLEAYGAVSEETAVEMARGIRRISGSDIGIAVTGIAGPGGATPDKPVGLVCFAISTDEGEKPERHFFAGSRDRIKNYSSLYAINMIRLFLIDRQRKVRDANL